MNLSILPIINPITPRTKKQAKMKILTQTHLHHPLTNTIVMLLKQIALLRLPHPPHRLHCLLAHSHRSLISSPHPSSYHSQFPSTLHPRLILNTNPRLTQNLKSSQNWKLIRRSHLISHTPQLTMPCLHPLLPPRARLKYSRLRPWHRLSRRCLALIQTARRRLVLYHHSAIMSA